MSLSCHGFVVLGNHEFSVKLPQSEDRALRKGGPYTVMSVRSGIYVKVTSIQQPKGSVHQIKVGVQIATADPHYKKWGSADPPDPPTGIAAMH